MDAHQEQADEQDGHRFKPEAANGHDHDADFGGFHQAHQNGFVMGVGDLSGDRGEEEIGQDEQTGRDRRQHLRLARIGGVEPEIGEEEQRELQQIVVERAQELDDEQGSEAAFAEK